MEAARIPWRPLGRLLVEQGLLTDEELEFALAKQQKTKRRLGETIVECGFVSPPDLSNALAAQYGIELISETGFGTGLRAQIQRRHESDRGRPALVSVPDLEQPTEKASLEPADPESTAPGEEVMLAQLEEQWAKLAAAEESLAERDAELALHAAERDRRRAQAARLAHRARAARSVLGAARDRSQQLGAFTDSVDSRVEEQEAKLAAAEQILADREHELAELTAAAARRRAQAVRFLQRLRAREQEPQHHAESVSSTLEQQRARLAAAEERLAERERELEALAADRDRRRAQVVRFARRVHERDEELARRSEEARMLGEAAAGLRDQAERLAGDVRGCDAEIDRLRRENARRRAQAARFAARVREQRDNGVEQRVDRDEQRVATPSSHLVFLQLANGYELVEREGPPPKRDSALELPGTIAGTLLVTGFRPSPFPGDARPCVIVQQS